MDGMLGKNGNSRCDITIPVVFCAEVANTYTVNDTCRV